MHPLHAPLCPRLLPSILDALWMDHVPNSTVLHATGSYDLNTIMKQWRLRWLGHDGVWW